MKVKRRIFSLLLSVCLTLGMCYGLGALCHEHVHAEEIQTIAANNATTASRSDVVATEAQIESMTCPANDGGCHVLGSTSGIFPHPDKPNTLVRGEMDEKYYEASCTRGSGTSSLRPCQYCHTWFTVVVDNGQKDATGHQFKEAEEHESTCDGLTYITEECSVCGFVKVTTKNGESIDPEKHTNKETSQITHDDCATDNVKITACKDCGVVISCESVGPKGHSGVSRLTKNGTCLENGTRTFECYNCKQKFVTEIKTKGNHLYVNKGKSATCTETGLRQSRCFWCDKADPAYPDGEVIPKLDHKWVEMESSACTNEKTWRCTVCNTTKTEGGGEIQHTWKQETLTMPATCTEAGYTYRQCQKCGATEKIADTEEPTGHDFSVPVVLRQATCGAEGQKTTKCSKCQEYSNVLTVIPATNAHTPAADDGDCTTPVYCTVCNQIVTEAKVAHEWRYTAIASLQGGQKQHKKTCKNCSTIETELCSGTDDGDCSTPIKCEHCNSTVKDGSIHVPGYESSRRYIPVPGETDDYHMALCSHNGCGQPVEWTKEPHTYENGTCTKCGHVHGKEHIPDGIYESDGEYHWQHCRLCGARTEITVHDVSADSPYNGDCTEALKCSVCDHVVREASVHHYEGSWQTTGEYHYRVCVNPGCEVCESYEHEVVDDHDCTTPNVCKDCNLVIVEGNPNHSWVYDGSSHTDTGHTLICDNSDCHQTMTEAHTAGIVANCTEQAECKICHSKFGALDPLNHNGNEEIRNAKEATEEEEGYTGDVYCLGCNQKKRSGSVIEKKPQHTHQYTEFQYDDTAHTPRCSICGKLNDAERSDHVWGSWEALENGEGHSRSCTVCHSVQRGAHEHSDAVSDCTADITCTICNVVIVKGQPSHRFNGRVDAVGDGHTVACTNENCRVSSDPVPHIGGEANCQSGAHCEVCGAEYGEKNPDVHTGGVELRNHRNPTTTEKGYTGDEYCLGCQALLKNGEEIDMLEEEHTHTYGDWESDLTSHWKECSCGAIESKGEHSYEEGVCTVCGAKDPLYVKVLVDPDNHIEAETPAGKADFYKDVQLTVDKLTADDEKYADVLKALGDRYGTFIPFDISLFDTVAEQNIQPESTLTIRMPVPEGWAANKTLVYHVDGDTATAVQTSISQDGKYVTFTVDHLSVYVLVNAESAKGKQPTSPQTGDNSGILLWIALAGFSAAGLIGLAVSKKRYEK